MDAPSTWIHDLGTKQTRMRRFLLDSFGQYSFLENGGHSKEVPHAHLHGIPVELSIDPAQFEGQVDDIESWADLRRRAAGAERYAYVETSRARYFVPGDQYWPILNMIRSHTVAQTDGWPCGVDVAHVEHHSAGLNSVTTASPGRSDIGRIGITSGGTTILTPR